MVREVRGTPFDTYEPTGQKRPLDSVRIEIPVMPRTFYVAGLNYAVHAREAALHAGKPFVLPAEPDVNYRATNALIAHGEAIVIPADATEQVQYEGELVVVIGKQAKRLSEEQALSCVLGYTIGNDVSERTWQSTRPHAVALARTPTRSSPWGRGSRPKSISTR